MLISGIKEIATKREINVNFSLFFAIQSPKDASEYRIILKKLMSIITKIEVVIPIQKLSLMEF